MWIKKNKLKQPTKDSLKANSNPVNKQASKDPIKADSNNKESKPLENEQKKTLRKRILNAIKEYEKYWLIYSLETYGIAGYFELPHKKIYIELLFYTPDSEDYPFLIHAVGNTTLNFSNLYEKYKNDYDIQPLAVLKDLEKLIAKQTRDLFETLKEKIDALAKNQIVFPVPNQKYAYIVRLIYTHCFFDILLDVSRYPRIPTITLKNDEHRKEIAKINKSYPSIIQMSIDNQLKKWKETNPLDFSEMFMDIETEIGIKIQDPEIWIRKKNQYIEAKDLILGENYKDISFMVKKGEHLGIYCVNNELVDILFRVLSRQSKSYRGMLNIFGNQEITANSPDAYKYTIFWINYEYNDRELKQTIEKTIGGNKTIKKAALEATLLDYDKKKRLSECSPLELLRVKISAALAMKPGAIAFRIPQQNIGKIEIEQFSRVLAKIKELFDVILIIHGPNELIQQCDKVAIIDEKLKTQKAGSITELCEDVPKTGEIIILQLTNPSEIDLEKMRQIPQTECIELRKNEKYKIFSQIRIESLTIQLFQLFGTKIYSYQRRALQLADLLELNQFKTESYQPKKLHMEEA
jgi:ABC-type multidrug transport system ATPase subunit